jgi:hypothetical protein
MILTAGVLASVWFFDGSSLHLIIATAITAHHDTLLGINLPHLEFQGAQR